MDNMDNNCLQLLRDVYDYLEAKSTSVDAPGHAHRIHGIWDGTGEPCQWCKKWDQVKECLNSDQTKIDNVILRDALIKLRDCDWIITLPDRMDGVRKIARDALDQAGCE